MKRITYDQLKEISTDLVIDSKEDIQSLRFKVAGIEFKAQASIDVEGIYAIELLDSMDLMKLAGKEKAQ